MMMIFNGWRASWRESFWFLPAIYNLTATLAAAIALFIDFHIAPDQLVGGLFVIPTTLSVEILSALAAAILTMTTITFSTMMVVLSTYSSQFSPRVLQNFIADRPTQHVLAIFSSGFTFSLIALLFMNAAITRTVIVSPVTAVLWGLVGIGAFVYFVHHAAIWMRVNNLIGSIALKTEATIERTAQWASGRYRITVNTDQLADVRSNHFSVAVPANLSGYVTVLHADKLLELARRDGATLVMRTRVGAYVMKNLPVMMIYADVSGDIDAKQYSNCIEFGDEQNDWQDIGFGLRKLVEIALRAVSPSVNDPYTAATCVHRMTPMLTLLAQRDQRQTGLCDADGQLRLVTIELRFEDYLFKAYNEIRHYGRSDMTVIASMLDSLTLIARATEPYCHDTLWRFGHETFEAFSNSPVLTASHNHVQQSVDALADATGFQTDRSP